MCRLCVSQPHSLYPLFPYGMKKAVPFQHSNLFQRLSLCVCACWCRLGFTDFENTQLIKLVCCLFHTSLLRETISRLSANRIGRCSFLGWIHRRKFLFFAFFSGFSRLSLCLTFIMANLLHSLLYDNAVIALAVCYFRCLFCCMELYAMVCIHHVQWHFL